MRINNNMLAINTHRQMGIAGTNQGKSMEKLSSGFRINRAGDDAAGLSISEKMRGQIRGLTQASRNAQDGISLIQTAEGALGETHAILQRMRELAVQAASDTNVVADRDEIQKEMTQLTSEINRIGNTTEFNTMKLVNGERSVAGDTAITVVADMSGADLNFSQGVTGDKFKFTTGTSGNVIKIDSANTAWGGGSGTAGVAGNVTITKLEGGKIQVKVDSTNSSGTNTVLSDDTYEADAAGNFKYDAHGISFEISKDDFANNAVDDKMSINISKADITAKKKAVENDFTKNASATPASGATVEGLKVTASGTTGFESMASVEGSYDSTSKQLTVTIKDADGKTLSKDVIDKVSGGTAYDYKNHGVEFKFTANGATDVAFSKDLKTKAGTKSKEDGSLAFQVGANENQAMSLDIGDMRASALGISSAAGGKGFASSQAVTDGTNNTAAEYSLSVADHKSAAASVTTINNAIEKVSSERSKLGAVQNRLEHTIKNLDTSAENLQASESRIRDVDMAKEMMNLTKQNILQQASQAMLAQANQAPQGVLQLLR